MAILSRSSFDAFVQSLACAPERKSEQGLLVFQSSTKLAPSVISGALASRACDLHDASKGCWSGGGGLLSISLRPRGL